MNQKNINCSLSVNDKSSNRQNLLLKMNKINSASPFKIEFDDPADESNRYTDNNFYRILAGGGKIRLMETLLELKIPELLGLEYKMSSREICQRLNLHDTRGWKLLHLLALSNFLIEEVPKDNYENNMMHEYTYRLSDETTSYFGLNGQKGEFFRDLIKDWKEVDNLGELKDIVLKNKTIEDLHTWPPRTKEAKEEIEVWMTITSEGAITNILASNAIKGCKNLLDVGGGDGTISIALVNEYKSHNMHATVFNLPDVAELASNKINYYGNQLKSLVTVHPGNFLEDELPSNHDCILFSRVLTDWSPDVCKMLFDKCRRSLAPGGKLVINEAFLEGNEDFVIAWEFRYIFFDSFGKFLFKPLSLYEKLLSEAGFKIIKVTPMTNEAFYSVLEAVIDK